MIVEISHEMASLLIRAISAGRLVVGEFTEDEQARLKRLVEELTILRQEELNGSAGNGAVR